MNLKRKKTHYLLLAFGLLAFGLLPTITYGAADFTLIGSDQEQSTNGAVNHGLNNQGTVNQGAINYDVIESPLRDMTMIRAGDTDPRYFKLNHDTGILDIYETNRKKDPPLDAASVLEFTELKQQLTNYGWNKNNAGTLSARLRLRVLTKTAPRLANSDASIYFPPSLDIDPPPPNVPIGVFPQETPWVAGDGQSRYDTATVEESKMLDLKNIGMVGFDLKDTHPFLSRDKKLYILNGKLFWQSLNGPIELTLSDVRIDKENDRWVEFDVSSAVQEWLTNGFQHGFALFQPGGNEASVRNNNFPYSRNSVTVVSSQADADCAGAGGKWGADGESAIFEDANLTCRIIGDIAEDGLPRLVAPLSFPDWRPQLIIENIGGSEDFIVPSAITFPDTTMGVNQQASIRIINKSNLAITLSAPSTEGADASAFSINDVCQTIPARQHCDLPITFTPQSQTEISANIVIPSDAIPGSTEDHFVQVKASVSGDEDGIPDAIENAGPNNGDGNNDGTQDSSQNNVSSLPSAMGSYLTFEAPEGSTFSNLKIIKSAVNIPPEERFNLGFWEFELRGVSSPNAIVNIFTETEHFGPYFKKTNGTAIGWEAFTYNSTKQTGAKRNQNAHQINFVDGSEGDDDGVVDNTIISTGGISFSSDLDESGSVEQVEGLVVDVTDPEVGSGSGSIKLTSLLALIALFLFRINGNIFQPFSSLIKSRKRVTN